MQWLVAVLCDDTVGYTLLVGMGVQGLGQSITWRLHRVTCDNFAIGHGKARLNAPPLFS
jgi:hypothetical protein